MDKYVTTAQLLGAVKRFHLTTQKHGDRLTFVLPNNRIVSSVSMHYELRFNHDCDGFHFGIISPRVKRELLDIIYRYSCTPIDKR